MFLKKSKLDALNKALINLGAESAKSDPCLYIINKNEPLGIIIVYVDDVLIMSIAITCKERISLKLRFERS